MMPQDDSGVVAAGTVLAGRYRVAEVLGSGGMGRVYRGEHTGFGKPVAIKVLNAALGRNEEAAIRFQREAVASGRLDHPNIVSVMDFGTLDDGSMFLVMEQLEGEPLGKRLDRDKRLPWLEAVTIIRSVLLGLHHAHDRGVVHRDIKPDNIFLADKGGDVVVKILDFGIAKLYAENKDVLAATRAGITVGTPRYLAPEQAVGSSITPSCDLYSSSVVLYEMLVGRAPFENEDPMAQLMAHVGSDVPAFRELAPDLEVPSALEEVVRHGLAKTPAERSGSALEYVQRLDEILRANGFEPAPIPTGRSARAGSAISGVFSTVTQSAGTARTPLPAIGSAPIPLPLAPTMPVMSAQADPDDQTVAARPEPVRKKPRLPLPRVSRRWWAIALGLVGGLAAIALTLVIGHSHHGGDSASRSGDASAQAAPVVRASSMPAAATAKPATTAASTSPTQPAESSGSSAAARSSTAKPASSPEHAKALKSALLTLHSGTSCAARKASIPTLVTLHDATAIPDLKKARTLSNNACLRASAADAIHKIETH